MIQVLQRKFIIAAMTAVSVFVFVLLGITNGANAVYTYHQNIDMLDQLCKNAAAAGLDLFEDGDDPLFSSKESGDRSESGKRGFNWFGVDLTDNYMMSAVYFAVTVDNDGNICTTYSGRSADTGIRETAEEIIGKGYVGGNTGNYRYKCVDLADKTGKVYVFHDISYQRHAVIRVAYTSLLVGILCIEIMYFFVRILAKSSIKPIAANMERQKQFITDAGHELKTPVAIILANTEAMELCTGETKWSRNIREQANRLSGLTQNLLTLAKIDENTFLSSVEQVCVSNIVNGITDMFIEPAALKHIFIDSNIEEDVCIKANPDMLSRLFSTLTDNAVKYASCDSTVEITLKKADKGMIFVIKNRCDELPKCEPEQLFDRFYRADSARTQKKGGFGIGLSAALAITELHKGSISAAFEPDNVVSFTVKL